MSCRLLLKLRVGREGDVIAGGKLGGEAGVLLINTDYEVILRGHSVEHQVEVAHLVPACVTCRECLIDGLYGLIDSPILVVVLCPVVL